MPFWRSRKSNKEGQFRWTPDSTATFAESFRVNGARGVSSCDLPLVLVHQINELHSWDLQVERRYFGWIVPEPSFRIKFGLSGVPAQLTIHQAEEPYQERISDDWGHLNRIGGASAWSRANADDEPDGFEVFLSLDSKRFRLLTSALRAHTAPIAPILTLGLVASNSAREHAGPSLSILAYWLRTWPLHIVPITSNPWSKAYDGLDFFL